MTDTNPRESFMLGFFNDVEAWLSQPTDNATVFYIAFAVVLFHSL